MGNFESQQRCACLRGDVNLLSKIMTRKDRRGYDRNLEFGNDMQYRNPLCCCVESGSIEAVDFFLSLEGVDIDYER